jgi:hypothetical protein
MPRCTRPQLNRRIWLVLCAGLAFGCRPPPAPPAPKPTPPQPTKRLSILQPPFSVALEQDGRAVPIVGHEAKIARRPFAIVLLVRDPRQGILMNVSLSPDLYDLARGGESVDGDFAPGTGLAEEQFLRSRALIIAGRNAHHYLIRDAQVNRYHEVKPVSGGMYRCRRVVDSVEFAGDEARERREPKVTLDQLDSEALYLVFFLGDSAGEKRRLDYVQLRFVPR